METVVPPHDREAAQRLSEGLRSGAADLAAAECRWLLMLAEFDRLGGWAEEGCRTCAHWLSWACGIGPEAARERVRVANALEGLPLVRDLFASGVLSYSKVRAITRVATPETEEVLVEWARHATAAQLERVVRGFRRMRRIEDAEAAHASYQKRYLEWRYDDDGSVLISARLPAEEGALVVQAIQQVAETLGEAEVAEPAPDPVPGEPSVHPPYGGLPERVAYSDDAANLWPARRADALGVLAETVLEHGPAARSGGDRTQVVVHVDAATLVDAGAGDRCGLDDGPELSVESVKRLLCDASVFPVLHGEDGSLLDVGRKSRSVPPAMRRAVLARDGGCRFPSCTATRFVDVHHIEWWWRDEGETRHGNLVCLCRFHHRLVHEKGYTIEVDPGGGVRFFRPDGTPVPEVLPPPPGDPDAAVAENRRLGLVITPDTPVVGDYNPRPDYGTAVGVLLTLTPKADAEAVSGPVSAIPPEASGMRG